MTGGLVRRLTALLAAVLIAPLAGVFDAPASTTALSSPAAYAYRTAAYIYDGPVRLSSPDTVARDARGSPPGRSGASWVSPVSVRDDGDATNTGAGVVESSVARTLTAAGQRSVASLQRQVAAHTEKFGAYRANPDAFDNLGYLERAPSPAIRQQIIDGRINHLETEIRGFQDQIDKLLGGS